jgi:hypothetical protein
VRRYEHAGVITASRALSFERGRGGAIRRRSGLKHRLAGARRATAPSRAAAPGNTAGRGQSALLGVEPLDALPSGHSPRATASAYSPISWHLCCGHASSPSRRLAPEAMTVTGARAPRAARGPDRWVRPRDQTGGLIPEPEGGALAPWAALRRPRAATYVPGAHSSTVRVADGNALRPSLGPSPRPAEIIRPQWTGAHRLKPT